MVPALASAGFQVQVFHVFTATAAFSDFVGADACLL